MTRKDYKIIASAIEHEVTGYASLPSKGTNCDALQVLDCFVSEICERLQADNPRFNLQKFYEATGLKQ